MEWWRILLIVIGIILLFVFLIYGIYLLVGKKYLTMIARCDSNENSMPKNMKASYYDIGPLKKMNQEGREYLVKPESCYGYSDKNWGKDFTSPWFWL